MMLNFHTCLFSLLILLSYKVLKNPSGPDQKSNFFLWQNFLLSILDVLCTYRWGAAHDGHPGGEAAQVQHRLRLLPHGHRAHVHRLHHLLPHSGV